MWEVIRPRHRVVHQWLLYFGGGRSRLQQLAQLVKARGVCFAFAPRPTKNLPPEVSEQIDPHTHLQSALSARHPLFAHALIDPSAEFAVELQETLGSDLSRWRRLVLDEIKELKEECLEETSSWFRQLPPHGRIAYQDRVFPNVPLLRRLGEIIGFPGLDELLRDISSGFCLLGRLEPGSCWGNKGVWKPEQVLSKEEFSTRNLEYIQHALVTRTVDPHAQSLLATVAQEVKEGKLSGPYTAPAHW